SFYRQRDDKISDSGASLLLHLIEISEPRIRCLSRLGLAKVQRRAVRRGDAGDSLAGGLLGLRHQRAERRLARLARLGWFGQLGQARGARNEKAQLRLTRVRTIFPIITYRRLRRRGANAPECLEAEAVDDAGRHARLRRDFVILGKWVMCRRPQRRCIDQAPVAVGPLTAPGRSSCSNSGDRQAATFVRPVPNLLVGPPARARVCLAVCGAWTECSAPPTSRFRCGWPAAQNKARGARADGGGVIAGRPPTGSPRRHYSMPQPRRRPALELLASSPDSCTEALMLANGFPVETLVELIRGGLAS